MLYINVILIFITFHPCADDEHCGLRVMSRYRCVTSANSDIMFILALWYNRTRHYLVTAVTWCL